MNNFEFNNTFYIQTHGTAMGTRMAPSYANLLLAKFETDALTHAPYQPHTWWRFIDDIFMIWTQTEGELRTFVTYLNTYLNLPSLLNLTLFSLLIIVFIVTTQGTLPFIGFLSAGQT